MKRLLDTLAAVVITVVIVMGLLSLIKPYVPWLLISLGIALVVGYGMNRLRRF